MYHPIRFVTVLLVICLSNCEAKEINSNPGRSARWDAYQMSNREKRSSTSEWQDKNQHPTCTLGDNKAFDALGRRASGLLATPQQQGSCGSCWAFASTHVFTDYMRLRGRNVPTYSQDYLTKCISPFRRRSQAVGNGCCGGSAYWAFGFMYSIGAVPGMCLPYTLSLYSSRNLENKRRNPLVCPTTCDNTVIPFSPSSNRIPGFTELPTEFAVISALADRRPVYARMEVTSTFKDYRCGVYCGNPIRKPNHGVEVVDYSSSNYRGTPYWVVKNSWGTGFGENGYFRIARGRNQLIGFVTISSTQLSSLPAQTPSLTAETCNAQTPDTEDDMELIASAVDYAITQFRRLGAVRCAENSTPVTSLSLSSSTNETVQVVDGFVVQALLEVNVEGCPDSTAMIDLTVMIDMDENFSVEEFVSSELELVTTTASAAHTSITLLVLAVCAMLSTIII